MSRQSFPSMVPGLNASLVVPATASNALPKNHIEIVPVHLQTAENLLIYNLWNIAKSDGHHMLSNLLHVWLYGRLAPGDSSHHFVERHAGSFYVASAQDFAGDDSFREVSERCRKNAIDVLSGIGSDDQDNKKISDLKTRLRRSGKRLKKINESALIGGSLASADRTARRTLNSDTADTQSKKIPLNTENNYVDSASAGIMRVSLEDREESETLFALGSFRIDAFVHGKITRLSEEEVQVRFEKLSMSLTDSFDYIGNQPLGVWTTAKFSRLQSAMQFLIEKSLLPSKSVLGLFLLRGVQLAPFVTIFLSMLVAYYGLRFKISPAPESGVALNNEAFRKFRNEFKHAFNGELDNYRTTGPRENLKITCRNFLVVIPEFYYEASFEPIVKTIKA